MNYDRPKYVLMVDGYPIAKIRADNEREALRMGAAWIGSETGLEVIEEPQVDPEEETALS